MTSKKPFYKKFLFWFLTTPLALAFLLFLPYFKFLFEYYVYNPPAHPHPEDFFVMPEKTPPEFKGLNAMPKEVVEVKADASKETKTVQHHRDGYTLELPGYLSVSTWDFEPDRIMVIDDRDEEHPCTADTYKMDDIKTVQEAFNLYTLNEEDEEEVGMYKIIRNELEEMHDSSIKLNAFFHHYENDLFGYQPNIYIQHDNTVFGISQNGVPYPECTLMMDVLKGFKFND